MTEEALRVLSYTGIAARDGHEIMPSTLLANVIKGNEVLVAIPHGVPAEECMRRFARPHPVGHQGHPNGTDSLTATTMRAVLTLFCSRLS